MTGTSVAPHILLHIPLQNTILLITPLLTPLFIVCPTPTEAPTPMWTKILYLFIITNAASILAILLRFLGRKVEPFTGFLSLMAVSISVLGLLLCSGLLFVDYLNSSFGGGVFGNSVREDVIRVALSLVGLLLWLVYRKVDDKVSRKEGAVIHAQREARKDEQLAQKRTQFQTITKEEDSVLSELEAARKKAEQLMEQKRYIEAAEELYILSEGGDRIAAEQLGLMYESNDYGMKSCGSALQFYKKADTGNARAWLAYAYTGTEFAPKDIDKVAEYKETCNFNYLSEPRQSAVIACLREKCRALVKQAVNFGDGTSPLFLQAFKYTFNKEDEKFVNEAMCRCLIKKSQFSKAEYAANRPGTNNPAFDLLYVTYRLQQYYPDEDLTGLIDDYFKSTANISDDLLSCKVKTDQSASAYLKKIEKLRDLSILGLGRNVSPSEVSRSGISFLQISRSNLSYDQKLYWAGRAAEAGSRDAMLDLAWKYRNTSSYRSQYWTEKVEKYPLDERQRIRLANIFLIQASKEFARGGEDNLRLLRAYKILQPLKLSPDPEIRSMTYNNLGVMYCSIYQREYSVDLCKYVATPIYLSDIALVLPDFSTGREFFNYANSKISKANYSESFSDSPKYTLAG